MGLLTSCSRFREKVRPQIEMEGVEDALRVDQFTPVMLKYIVGVVSRTLRDPAHL